MPESGYMKQQLGTQDALISAITQGDSLVSFLIGSPLSTPDYPKGPGVPGVQGVLEIVAEHVRIAGLEAEYLKQIEGHNGAASYQQAFAFVLTWLGQDVVNKIVETAVLRARIESGAPSECIDLDSDVGGWYLPRGIRALGEIVAQNHKFLGPVLTTNFDPLAAIAIKSAGGEPLQTVLHADGSLGDHRTLSERHRHVIHLHGYWNKSDTLHTPDQLTVRRPMLKASLSRLLSERKLLVIGYGGWDDVFISALRELMADERTPLDVLWAFKEADTQTIYTKYESLLKEVEPARARGRFRMYSGIECNNFFQALASSLSKNYISTNIAQRTKSQAPVQQSPTLEFVSNTLKSLSNPLLINDSPHGIISELLSDSSGGPVASDIDQFEEWRPHSSPAHVHVRAVEQAQFLEALESDRVVFVTADWGLGKDGFITAAQCVEGSPLAGARIYRIDADGVNDRDGLLATATAQLGAPIQVFALAASKIDQVTLILDCIGTPSGAEEQRTWLKDLSEVVSALVDFLPKLRIILIGRRELPGHKYPSVHICPLDEADTRTYIENHAEGGPGLSTGDSFNVIFRMSRGVPMQLDRLLSELSVISIDDLLESEYFSNAHNVDEAAEPIPVALERALMQLVGSDLDHHRRSNYLLKVLSVLAYGEPLGNIKRFDPLRPFYPSQVRELRDLGLLESTPIITPAPTSITSTPARLTREAAPKILTIPPQVREYVMAKLTTDEVNDIVTRAAELTFGPDWRQGTIKLNSAAREHLQDHSRSGAGNPHLLVVHLLRHAIDCNDINFIKKAFKIGTSYCSSLKEHERFRDVVHAASELLTLAGDTPGDLLIAKLQKLYGQGLRMIDREEEAICELQKALEVLIKQDKLTAAEAYLSLALAYQSRGYLSEATRVAKETQRLLKPDDSRYLQATSIIIECDKSNKSDERLCRLEIKSRKSGSLVVANNISIDLAGKENNLEKKIYLYNRVISCESDPYNQMRAVVKKGEVLTVNSRLQELQVNEQRLLSRTYGYSFTQRLKTLFNNSHKILWDLLEIRNDRTGLFHLFRYSSLIWRLEGDSQREQQYAERLRGLVAGEYSSDSKLSDASEIIRYVKVRIRIISRS